MNVARHFDDVARSLSGAAALAVADRHGKTATASYADLQRWADGYAQGFQRAGLRTGDRVLLLMRPGIEFAAVILGLLKAGLVAVLIDPGMDRATLLRCVRNALPDAVVADPRVFLLMAWHRATFGRIRRRWHTGPGLLPGSVRLLRRPGDGEHVCIPVDDDAAAAIVFTTGSTGTPKGVVVTHGNYAAERDALIRHFGIVGGQWAITSYPPFSLLCICMGNPCILPPRRVASHDDRDLAVAADLVARLQPAVAMGAPGFWEGMSDYCRRQGRTLDSLRTLLLFGAEADETVLRNLRSVLPGECEIHTPYGATEAQPISSASDRTLLSPQVLERRDELGICVGSPLQGVEIRVIRISDEPLSRAEALDVEFGAIGEVLVRGGMVTSRYFRQPEECRLHKIDDELGTWHRMGDCGSFDEQGRLWLVGRKRHRIQTASTTLFPLPIESIVNRHPEIRRSALVGVGIGNSRRPVIVVELRKDAGSGRPAIARQLIDSLAIRAPLARIRDVLFHPGFPVDYRHGTKIQRELLATWAAPRVPAVANGDA